MKKLFFALTLFFIVLNTSAQSDNDDAEMKRNELKINVAYLLGGIPEVGYEYLLNEESGVGINMLFSIDKSSDLRFALTPYYRFYFGKKKAAGFFAEGFGMVNTLDPYNDDYHNGYYKDEYGSQTDLALGVAIGGKFKTKSNFIFEIYMGVGRNLFNKKSEDIVPRGGITFGKRF